MNVLRAKSSRVFHKQITQVVHVKEGGLLPTRPASVIITLNLFLQKGFDVWVKTHFLRLLSTSSV